MVEVSATPFIASLSDDDRRLVDLYARNPRPTYYSAVVQALADQADKNGLNKGDFDPNVTISEDFEALLIIMPPAQKSALIELLRQLAVARTMPDELDLMQEVLAIRRESYVLVKDECANQAIALDATYTSVIQFMTELYEKTRAIPENEVLSQEPTAVLVPDLGNLFSNLTSFISDLNKTEVMSAHDTITDQMTLVSYSGSFLNRTKEILSWADVVNSYMTLMPQTRTQG